MPAIWAVVWRNVWMVHPETGAITNRHATVRTFTVAYDRQEAIAISRSGLFEHDDIEDPGRRCTARRVVVPSAELPGIVAAMLQCGRFIIPYRHLSAADVMMLIECLLGTN